MLHHAEREAQGVRASRRLDHEGHEPPSTVRGQEVHQLIGRHGHDTESSGHLAPPGPQLHGHDAGAGTLEHEGGQGSDHAETHHDHGLAEQRSGIQGDLQGCFDQWEDRGRSRPHGAERDHVGGRGHEAILMRLEGEHQRAVAER